MKIRMIVAAVMTLLVASAAPARDLTLETALAKAENHSFALKRAVSERQAQESALRQMKAERFPTLVANATAMYKDEAPQFSIPLPLGQSLTRQYGYHETYQVDARVTVPVFTGGKITSGVDAARASLEYTRAMEMASQNEVLLMTRTAFFGLYGADQLLKGAQASIERAQVINREVRSLYDAGAADSVDLLDASLAVTNASLHLREAQNNRRQKEIELLVLLGENISDTIRLSEDLPSPIPPQFTFDGILDLKPELEAAKSSVKLNRALNAQSRASYFPDLSLIGGYSYGKPNIDPFSDSFNDYWTVGVNVSWSFNVGGKTSNRVASSRYRLEASGHQLDLVSEQLHRQAKIALESLSLTYDRYETARENFRIASESFRLASIRHDNGTLSANRLVEIESQLTEADAQLASSQADYYVVQSLYYFHVGYQDKLRKGF